MASSTTIAGSSWMRRAHDNAGWLTALGIIEIVAGFFALLAPLASGLGVTIMLGAAILVGGIVRLFAAFKAESFGSGTLAFIWGLVVAVAGFYIATNPGLGLLSLTLVLSIVFFVSGLTQIVVSFEMKPARGWGWMLAGGILTVVLAILVWRQFPFSGVWFVGALIGVSLISNGLVTLNVGTAVRKWTAEA